MKLLDSEIRVQGSSICRGVAIGKPYFFFLEDELVSDEVIDKKEVEKEINRFHLAILRCIEDLKHLIAKMKYDSILEGAAILEAHLQMLQDPIMTSHIEELIGLHCKKAESALYMVIKDYQKRFQALKDSFFRQRFNDLKEVARRLIGYLRANSRPSLARIPERSIVFAEEICSGDILETSNFSTAALVTHIGSATTHAAIVAKAKGIPYVSNVDFWELEIPEDRELIVDGRSGEIIINPTAETLDHYRELQQRLYVHHYTLEHIAPLAPETYDGYHIQLSANIEMRNELPLLHKYGGQGIGLFRSENVLFTNGCFPSEQEQFEVYRQIVEGMQGLPIVIRTFDVGGDKVLFFKDRKKEVNPFLGCRAIRFLLREKEIFKTQLRAILRASQYGKVSILFPMITDVTELIEAKRIVKEAEEELLREGISVRRPIRIGSMIEVPSAALIVDLLVKECDFLSIGTNDLVQYSLAVDRCNHAISPLYSPTHPGILRLIRRVAQEANKQNIPVSVCGEIASDPRFTALLLGLGIHELSVASRYLLPIKNAIRNCSIVGSYFLAEQALQMSTAKEVSDLITSEYQRNVPGDCYYNY